MPTFRLPAIVICALVAGAVVVQCGEEGESDGAASGFVKTAQTRKGRQLYLTSGCPLCHGKEGRGDGKLAPNYDPRPADLGDPAALKRGTSAEALASTITDGISDKGGSKMPAYPHLADRDRRHIAHFIRSLWAEAKTTAGK